MYRIDEIFNLQSIWKIVEVNRFLVCIVLQLFIKTSFSTILNRKKTFTITSMVNWNFRNTEEHGSFYAIFSHKVFQNCNYRTTQIQLLRSDLSKLHHDCLYWTREKQYTKILKYWKSLFKKHEAIRN